MRALPQVETKVVKHEIEVERRFYSEVTASYPKYNFGSDNFFYRFRLVYELIWSNLVFFYFSFFSKVYLPGRITARKKNRVTSTSSFFPSPPPSHLLDIKKPVVEKKSGHTLQYFISSRSLAKVCVKIDCNCSSSTFAPGVLFLP